MKNLIILYSICLFLTSCATEWSKAEQDKYMADCLQFSGDQTDICECGLKKAMKTYNSSEEAKTAIQKMKQVEVEDFFAECL